jgi:hypothetical protein
MSSITIYVLRFSLPPSIIFGCLLKIWFNPSLELLFESVVGFAIAILLLALYTKRHNPQRVLWHEDDGTLAVIRPWTIEVCAALLLTTVPIGIDLSHSAKRVLESMHIRLGDTTIPSEFRFFVTRPLTHSPTLAGFMIIRKLPRLPKVLERLRIAIEDDMEILEGIMRSAYHHVTVRKASCDDIIKIASGGTVSVG